ncbi:hypothetical protein NC651_001931 [Populus alba x Populus x berolinensis]|nr:hypothetical protein NC651_001931 [Populus alba x Populus x berolinensis]
MSPQSDSVWNMTTRRAARISCPKHFTFKKGREM